MKKLSVAQECTLCHKLDGKKISKARITKKEELRQVWLFSSALPHALAQCSTHYRCEALPEGGGSSSLRTGWGAQQRDFAWHHHHAAEYKVTYRSCLGPSDRESCFLSSQGTACKMLFRVFRACSELERAIDGEGTKQGSVSMRFYSNYYLFCYLPLTSCWVKWVTVFSVTRDPKVNMKESNIWIFPESVILKQSNGF